MPYHDSDYNPIEHIMELLIKEGPDAMAEVYRRLANMAMSFERDAFLGATPYERSDKRRGYANGFKLKKVDTPAGASALDIPKTRGLPETEHHEPFYLQALERGRRVTRAVILTIAQIYIRSVSTRDVRKVMAEFGIKSISSSQVKHAPSKAIHERLGDELRRIWNAADENEAKERLKHLVTYYADKDQGNAPALADWLEANIPEGLSVFTLPRKHQRRMRTSNGIERPIQQELKRRTRKIRIFPSTDSLLRLTTALLVEIDEEWATNPKRYLTWEDTPPA